MAALTVVVRHALQMQLALVVQAAALRMYVDLHMISIVVYWWLVVVEEDTVRALQTVGRQATRAEALASLGQIRMLVVAAAPRVVAVHLGMLLTVLPPPPVCLAWALRAALCWVLVVEVGGMEVAVRIKLVQVEVRATHLLGHIFMLQVVQTVGTAEQLLNILI